MDKKINDKKYELISKILNYFCVRNNDSDAISLSEIDTIKTIMKKSICKINMKNHSGTGFFCYIPIYNSFLPALITNYHILNENDTSLGKTINISLNDDAYIYKLFIDITRITYLNKNFDITFLEIKKTDSLIKMISFLNIDENIFKTEEYNYKKLSVLNFHYPFGKVVKFSIGKIIDIHGITIYYLIKDIK